MISFCIITDGREPEKLKMEIDSILAIKDLPEHEIVLSGANTYIENVDTYVPMASTARQGRLGALRNGACMAANGDILVVTDDDMIFVTPWYKGMEFIGDKWDLLSCKILNPDGSRYWDWKCHEGGGNWLLDYDKTDPRISLTGGMTIMKRRVFETVKWNNNLGFNQAEDVDFTNKVKQAGFNIKFNPYSTIIHNAPYTQKGVGVVRLLPGAGD